MLLGAIALLARLLVVAWAWGRFPPAADGAYYHRLAVRLSEGNGYTWLWPDGAVTFAAHYPVGYPAVLATIYAAVGPLPESAMLFNAVVGAAGCLAVHRLLVQLRVRAIAWVGAGLVALHPALVGYTPALMTEGVTAALVALAAWAALAARGVKRPRFRVAAMASVGAAIGVCTLVRPQCIVLAPLFGLWLAWGRPGSQGSRSTNGRWWGGLLVCVSLVTASAVAVCAPWTLRNCVHMGRCALVSVNGGWNLLIGTNQAARGAWAPLEVPPTCRNVFDEAAKDLCFEQAAYREIRERPGRWLGLAPQKLAATFDYCGAPGWYLHESNPAAFGPSAKLALGSVETVYERLVLVFAALSLRPKRCGRVTRRRLRAQLSTVLAWSGAACALSPYAWLGYAAVALALLLRRPTLGRGPAVHATTWAVLVSVMATHVVFFGAGRYSLVVFPLLCALAAIGLVRSWRGRLRAPVPAD